MSRARILAVALVAAAAGCTSSGRAPPTSTLSQPSALATFSARIDPNPDVGPYLAVANSSRNDLMLVDATNDVPVKAPVQLRPLAVPVPDRPSLLVATSLGEETLPGGVRRPDLLVVVSAGDYPSAAPTTPPTPLASRLQVLDTWSGKPAVVAEVDFPGDDVLALAAIPSPPGTARIAVSLSGRQLAVVHFARSATSDAIEHVPPSPPQPLAFEAIGLATVPGDQAHVYAASLEPVGPGPVYGVAEIDVSAAGPWPVRALGARAATRLVAAAVLHAERRSDAVANDVAAFAGQPPVTRVYAVLDEGSCGLDKPIPCGVVALDPALDTAIRGSSIPDEFAPTAADRWMPYRAPIRISGRPLALVVSGPPLLPPSAEVADQVYKETFMRFATNADPDPAKGFLATTAVGAVVADDGSIHFLDLGRFKEGSLTSVPGSSKAAATEPRTDERLWLQKLGVVPAEFVDTKVIATDLAAAVAAAIPTAPGWTPTETWTVAYQGGLPNLAQRRAEAGRDGVGNVWLAVQTGLPGAKTQVGRLFHPSLGVKVGDIVVIQAAGIDGCTGTAPPGTPAASLETVPKEFEVSIGAVHPPDAARPGGFVTIGPRAQLTDEAVPDPAWTACLGALGTKIDGAPGGVATGLVASFHAGGLVLTGKDLGYAGRPEFGIEYDDLQYRYYPDPVNNPTLSLDEDQLAASCPLADWDGSFPAPPGVLDCGGAGCDPARCEALVLSRKARRVHHLSETCPDQACTDRYPGVTFPFVNGPAVRFQVAAQNVPAPGTPVVRRRGGLTLGFTTLSGSLGLIAKGGAVTAPGGAIAFDRSPYRGAEGQAAGYRFYVSYLAGLVVDVTPHVYPASSVVIR